MIFILELRISKLFSQFEHEGGRSWSCYQMFCQIAFQPEADGRSVATVLFC